MSNRQAHITKKMDIMTAEAKQKMAKKDKAGELLPAAVMARFMDFKPGSAASNVQVPYSPSKREKCMRRRSQNCRGR